MAMTPPDPFRAELLLEDCDWLRRLARTLVRDVHRAEDAVQETLVAAVEKTRRDGKPSKSWLSRVLHNSVRQEVRGRERRAQREAARPGPRSSPPSREIAERLELQRRVFDAVSSLEPLYRDVLVLRHFDGKPPRKIAKELGLPVKTVNTRLSRGIEKLRARLDADFGGRRDAWVSALIPIAKGGVAAGTTGGLTMAGTIKITAGLVVAATLGLVLFAQSEGSNASAPPDPPRGILPTAPSDDDSPPRESAPLELREERRVPAVADENSLEDLVSAGENVADLLVRASLAGAAPRPFAQVSVICVRDSGAPSFRSSRETDLSGEARFTVPAGAALRVEVAYDGDPEEVFEVLALEPGTHHALDCELRASGDRTFHGVLVDAGRKEAVPDAPVVPLWGDSSGVVRTDPEGRFQLRYPARGGTRHALLEVEGFAPRYLELTAEHGQPDRARTIELEAGRRVNAHLVHVAGEPVRGVTLRLTASRSELSIPEGRAVTGSWHVWEQESDADGVAALRDLPRGVPLTAEVRRDGELVWRRAQPLRLGDEDPHEPVFVIEEGLPVLGRVTDGGGRGVECELWLLRGTDEESSSERPYLFLGPHDVHRAAARVRSDETGRFRFDGVQPGDWWLGIAPPPEGSGVSSGPACLAQHLAVEPGIQPAFQELRAHFGLVSTGTILRSASEPMRFGYVYVSRADAHGSLRVAVESDGTWQAGPLPAGRFQAMALDGETMGRSGWVGFQAGEQAVELDMRGGRRISGRVLDENGEPVNAHVSLVWPSGSLGMGAGARGTGMFTFDHLEPGTYSLRAGTEEGAIALLGNVHLGEEPIEGLELVLVPGARVLMKLSGDLPRGRAAVYSDGILVDDFTLRNGSDSYVNVPSGPISVELYVYEDSRRIVVGEDWIQARTDGANEIAFEIRR